jgi:hypothetical protein
MQPSQEFLMAKATIVPVSFDKTALVIGKAQGKVDKVSALAASEIQKTMQQFIDKWFTYNGREKSSVVAMGKTVRESETVAALVASGVFEKKTFTEYAQSAMRALHWNVAFEASLKNNPEKSLPWGKGKTSDVGKAGPVTSITRDAADKTLSKALAQYRALGLTEFAANLLDLAIESLDGFKETVLDK